MKKILINYYAVVMLVLFMIYNMTLENLKIGGILYQLTMIIVIILNSLILIKFKQEIKGKGIVIIFYFLIWLYSKNMLQCFFDFSNILVLCMIGFMESNFIKVISILISLFGAVFFLPFYFIFLLTFGTSFGEEVGRDDIYEDTHYYCDEHYEIYSDSLGAMDGFHYSIGKYYEILNLDGILYVSYHERISKTEKEYSTFLKSHSCKLVGDKNGSK